MIFVTEAIVLRRVSEALAKARGVKIVDEVDQRLFERDARAVMGIIDEVRKAEREDCAEIIERNGFVLPGESTLIYLILRAMREGGTDNSAPSGRTEPVGNAGSTALPVAWRVKDFADGWILCHSLAEAQREAEGAGNRIEALVPA